MDFVYIEDVARANILAAKADVTDEVFNVASGTETSLKRARRDCWRGYGVRPAPEYVPERKVNPVQRRLADIEKAARMLGFRGAVSLERRPRGW